MAMRIPAGLRSQTPMSQTASNPRAAMESHSSWGTVARVTGLFVFLAQFLKPDPGVDFIDDGISCPDHIFFR